MAKILYINPEGHTGLAYHDHSLCNALQKAGHDVTLVTCLEFPSLSLPQRFEAVRYYPRWNGNKIRQGIMYALATLGLVRYAVREKPDIIHFEVLRIPVIDIVTIGLLKYFRFPIVLHVHDASPLEQKLFRMVGYQQCYRIVDHLTTYAIAAKLELMSRHNLPDGKITVLTHGHYCDFISAHAPDVRKTRRSLGLEEDDHVILFFGVLRESKGLDILLRAMPRVLENDSRAKLLIAGKPRWESDLDKYKQLISQLGLADRVILRTTFIPDGEVDCVFAAVDVVALPYLKAYYSGVIKLSYSHGKAVVASKLGGLIELLEDGQTGIFVEPGDPEDLAEKLLILLKNPELCRQMGEAGRRWARKEFAWSKTAMQLTALYSRFQKDHGDCSWPARV